MDIHADCGFILLINFIFHLNDLLSIFFEFISVESSFVAKRGQESQLLVALRNSCCVLPPKWVVIVTQFTNYYLNRTIPKFSFWLTWIQCIVTYSRKLRFEWLRSYAETALSVIHYSLYKCPPTKSCVCCDSTTTLICSNWRLCNSGGYELLKKNQFKLISLYDLRNMLNDGF